MSARKRPLLAPKPSPPHSTLEALIAKHALSPQELARHEREARLLRERCISHPFYAKADVAVSTAGKSIEESFAALRDAVADVAVAVRQAAD